MRKRVRVAQGMERAERETASRQITRNGDVFMADTLRKQCAIGGDGIVDGRRKAMLRRQMVFEREYIGLRGFRQT